MNTFARYSLSCQKPFYQNNIYDKLKEIMSYWQEGSNFIAILPCSASDVVSQCNMKHYFWSSHCNIPTLSLCLSLSIMTGICFLCAFYHYTKNIFNYIAFLGQVRLYQQLIEIGFQFRFHIHRIANPRNAKLSVSLLFNL